MTMHTLSRVRSLIDFTNKKGESFLIDDVEAVERVESELDAFIEKRDREDKEANAIEVAYAASVRRFHQKRHQQNAWRWYHYHAKQLHRHVATFEALTTRHKAEVDRFARILGMDEVEAGVQVEVQTQNEGGGSR